MGRFAMIVRQGTAPIETRVASDPMGAAERRNFSDVADPAGAVLRQFGAALETLMPGATSSERHWHEVDDEFLLMLRGTATVIDDNGPHQVEPGQVVCWPAGDPNGHRVTNRTKANCTYLIVGTRGADEVVHYPDQKWTQIDDRSTWRIEAADGSILKQGPLPAHLTGLLERPRPPRLTASAGTRILRREDAQIDAGTPEQNAVMGEFEGVLYSDAGGLTQFGAFVETLQPGARSSDRHWHEQEDEFLFLLTGEATVIEDDGPHHLHPGDAAVWPAGVADGHHVVNRSGLPCSYLVVGSRLPSDTVHYSDIDKLYVRENGVARRTRRDGSPFGPPANGPA